MIIQINKTVYQSLSESERCVIDFINQNEAKIPLLSITSIADKTFTSLQLSPARSRNAVFRELPNSDTNCLRIRKMSKLSAPLMLSMKFSTNLSGNAPKPLITSTLLLFCRQLIILSIQNVFLSTQEGLLH